MKRIFLKNLSCMAHYAAAAIVLACISGGSAFAFSAWTATGSLNTVRYGHSSTLLPNGKVLVAGGANTVYLASAELYDPATGLWTATGDLHATRCYHTATLLQNGKVLVAGGFNGVSLATAELYDPATGLWTTTGSLSSARQGHTATLLPSGKVLVAGGLGSAYLASAELYDPAPMSWATTGSLNTARDYHTATLMSDGKVLVAGGYNTVNSYLTSTELYNPATGFWTDTGSLSTARDYHTATLMSDGKVLVAGGYDGRYLTSAEVYDPATISWTTTSSLNTSRQQHTATLLPDGRVVAAGGFNGRYLPSTELYDPETKAWTASCSSLSVSRRSHTATLLSSGKVLIAGGYNGSAIGSAALFMALLSAPVAVADDYSTEQNTTLYITSPNILKNDIDSVCDDLSALLVSTTSHGSLTLLLDGTFVYTPAAGFTGIDRFTYKATNFTDNSTPAEVLIAVSNSAPEAVADNYTTPRNTPLTVAAPGVLANDNDTDSDSLTAALTNTPDHGRIVLNADGSFVYTPNAGFRGMDTFAYRVSDGVAHSLPATVRITVGSNAPPVVEFDNYTTPRNKPLPVAAPGVLVNDNDTDHDPLTAVLANTTDHGTLVLSDNGSFTYTPQTGYVGTDIFTYRAYDGYDYSAIATVRITVGSNAPPVVQSDNYTTPRNTKRTVDAPGVLGNDTDADHDPLIAVLSNTTDHGTLVLSDNGSFTYTPDGGYVGTDIFTYRAYDGYDYSAIATVRITVGSNAAPVVTPDNYTTPENTPLPVSAPGVLGNDTDGDGDPLTAVLVRNPAHGTLVFSDNGSFTYTPNTGYRGRDTFTYRAHDGMANSGVATVTIIVGSNAAPVVTPDSYFVERNDTLTVPADGVLGNDSDPDNDTMTAVLVTSTANGALTFSADGSFTYTPLTDYRGLDSFSYKANDGMADSAVVTVTITVGSNEPPRVVSDNYSTERNTPLLVAAPGVLGNDSDPDGDNMTVVLAAATVHGTLVLSDNGSFTYTPDDGFVGIDTFTYRANDGMADSAIATVVIHVGHNAVPQVASDNYIILMNTTLTVAEPGVLSNDVDADNDTLTAVLVSTAVHGALTLSDNGSFTYTPVTGFVGIDTFTYVANDGYADSAVATVSINVFAPSGGGGGGGSGGGAPLAVADSYRTAARTTPLVISAPGVLGNDSGGLTAILEAEPMFGSLALNENGSFIYISTAEHGCTDTFMYSASNGSAKSAAVTVTIIVNAAPSAASDSYSVNPNMPALVVAPGVLANDSDGDGDKLQSELVSAPLNGTFILAADGSFQYTPNWGFIGNDSFTYRAYDGFEYSAPVTVTLSVKFTCPLVAVYGEGSSEVAALRKFRDGVLEKTDAGRAMIKLYYRMAPALEPVMSNNTWLKQAARAVIDRILPVLGRWSK